MTSDTAHGRCNYLPASDGDCPDFRFQARSCGRLLNHFDLFAFARLILHSTNFTTYLCLLFVARMATMISQGLIVLYSMNGDRNYGFRCTFSRRSRLRLSP